MGAWNDEPRVGGSQPNDQVAAQGVTDQDGVVLAAWDGVDPLLNDGTSGVGVVVQPLCRNSSRSHCSSAPPHNNLAKGNLTGDHFEELLRHGSRSRISSVDRLHRWVAGQLPKRTTPHLKSLLRLASRFQFRRPSQPDQGFPEDRPIVQTPVCRI